MISKAEYSVNAGDWTVVQPTTRLSDAPDLQYDLTVDAPDAERTIAVQVTDEYDDQAESSSALAQYLLVIRFVLRNDPRSRKSLHGRCVARLIPFRSNIASSDSRPSTRRACASTSPTASKKTVDSVSDQLGDSPRHASHRGTRRPLLPELRGRKLPVRSAEARRGPWESIVSTWSCLPRNVTSFFHAQIAREHFRGPIAPDRRPPSEVHGPVLTHLRQDPNAIENSFDRPEVGHMEQDFSVRLLSGSGR